MNAFAQTYRQAGKIEEQHIALQFLRAICSGNAKEAAACFSGKSVCENEPDIYAPNGNAAGNEQIIRFSSSWLTDFEADTATVLPITQIVNGLRSISEVIICFNCGSVLREMPMAVAAETDMDGKIVHLRLYFHHLWCKKALPYRAPLFVPTNNAPADVNRLCGVVKPYFEALHSGERGKAVSAILSLAEENICFGGYKPPEVGPIGRGLAYMRKEYELICSEIPHEQIIRIETVTDNGQICAVEWVSIVTRLGLEKGIVSQSGIAMYERSPKGKLAAVRICDNLRFEHKIDRAHTNIINYIAK